MRYSNKVLKHIKSEPEGMTQDKQGDYGETQENTLVSPNPREDTMCKLPVLYIWSRRAAVMLRTIFA